MEVGESAAGQERIKELAEEKKQLEIDLQKIMSNLTRW